MPLGQYAAYLQLNNQLKRSMFYIVATDDFRRCRPDDIIYYTTLSWGENFAIDGYLSPFIGLWGPDMIFMILGIYLIIKGGNSFPNLNFIKKIIVSN